MFALVGKDGVFWGRQVSGGGAKVRMPRAAWVDDDADDNDDDMTSIDAAAALRRTSRRTTHHLASPTHSLTLPRRPLALALTWSRPCTPALSFSLYTRTTSLGTRPASASASTRLYKAQD